MRNVANGVSYDEDWAADLEDTLDEEFTRLSLALESDDPELEAVDITGTPYDGCATCEQRTYIAIVARATLEGARDGRVELA